MEFLENSRKISLEKDFWLSIEEVIEKLSNEHNLKYFDNISISEFPDFSWNEDKILLSVQQLKNQWYKRIIKGLKYNI